MIVDCYTHIWDSPEQLGLCATALQVAPKAPPALGGANGPTNASAAYHLVAAKHVDATIVVGFKSQYLKADIPNDTIAAHVNNHPDRLIGFAGIDPTDPVAAIEEMERARSELGLKGISLCPAAQNLHPSNSKTEAVCEQAAKMKMPVIFHTGVHIARQCAIEYAQPVLLDAVAREHRDLKMVIAHMGYPWVQETIVMLAKNENVLADISWLLHRPWEAYQAILAAYQYGVMDKLLFGSGFPHSTPAQSIETLYGINHLCGGTNLPTIPREALRSIVERDALALLGVEHALVSERARSREAEAEEEVELT